MLRPPIGDQQNAGGIDDEGGDDAASRTLLAGGPRPDKDILQRVDGEASCVQTDAVGDLPGTDIPVELHDGVIPLGRWRSSIGGVILRISRQQGRVVSRYTRANPASLRFMSLERLYTGRGGQLAFVVEVVIRGSHAAIPE